uniref:Uncharacterized protein n=1 Tax=Arundo donax TaxID=35708 RepID=A0A0A8ZCC6_ARUDO
MKSKQKIKMTLQGIVWRVRI